MWKEPAQHVDAAYDFIVLTEGSPVFLKQMHLFSHAFHLFVCGSEQSVISLHCYPCHIFQCFLCFLVHFVKVVSFFAGVKKSRHYGAV